MPTPYPRCVPCLHWTDWLNDLSSCYYQLYLKLYLIGIVFFPAFLGRPASRAGTDQTERRSEMRSFETHWFMGINPFCLGMCMGAHIVAVHRMYIGQSTIQIHRFAIKPILPIDATEFAKEIQKCLAESSIHTALNFLTSLRICSPCEYATNALWSD